MRLPSYRRVGTALAAGALLALGAGVSATSAQTQCTVCLSSDGQLYRGGNAAPYDYGHNAPIPYSSSSSDIPDGSSSLDDMLKILQIVTLTQQLEQQAQQQQQLPPAPPPAPAPSMPPPTVSPNHRYSTSNGVKTTGQIQYELQLAGYPGPLWDEPAVLAAYQRTTNSPVRPL